MISSSDKECAAGRSVCFIGCNIVCCVECRTRGDGSQASSLRIHRLSGSVRHDRFRRSNVVDRHWTTANNGVEWSRCFATVYFFSVSISAILFDSYVDEDSRFESTLACVCVCLCVH
jgi:hypothetical protein